MGLRGKTVAAMVFALLVTGCGSAADEPSPVAQGDAAVVADLETIEVDPDHEIIRVGDDQAPQVVGLFPEIVAEGFRTFDIDPEARYSYDRSRFRLTSLDTDWPRRRSGRPCAVCQRK